MSQVYAPSFVEKLAERGIAVTDEAELAHALKIAAFVRSESEKTANAVSPLAKASSLIDSVDADMSAQQTKVAALAANADVREALTVLSV